MQADETQRSRVRNAGSRAADKKYPTVRAGRGVAIAVVQAHQSLTVSYSIQTQPQAQQSSMGKNLTSCCLDLTRARG